MWPDYIESSCRDFYSYFWTADYLRTAYHCTAILTLPLSLFTFYVIWTITPAKMAKLKVPLLIFHGWSTNLDLVFTVLSAPLVFGPSAAGIPLGIIGRIGVPTKWQAYWGQVSVFMMGVCFVMLYENRQSQITTIKFKIKRKRTRMLLFIANYLMACTFELPFYLDDLDQLELRKLVLKKTPCPILLFYDPDTFVLMRSGQLAPFVFISAGLLLLVGQTFFFMFHTFYHLFHVENGTLSKATRTLQKKFLGCVTFQISIPMLALLTPTIYTIWSDKHDYYNQAFNNNAMLAMSNHGLLSSMCTLMIYKPYRDFVRSLFVRRARIEDSSVVRSQVSRSS